LGLAAGKLLGNMVFFADAIYTHWLPHNMQMQLWCQICRNGRRGAGKCAWAWQMPSRALPLPTPSRKSECRRCPLAEQLLSVSGQ